MNIENITNDLNSLLDLHIDVSQGFVQNAKESPGRKLQTALKSAAQKRVILQEEIIVILLRLGGKIDKRSTMVVSYESLAGPQRKLQGLAEINLKIVELYESLLRVQYLSEYHDQIKAHLATVKDDFKLLSQLQNSTI